MPFVRLTDNYNDDPKIDALSDGSYRLWHNMLAYCRRMQTDGLIPKSIMLGSKHYRPKRLDEMMQLLPFEKEPLLSKVEGFGFKMANYLKWNPSKDEENERRLDSRERMRSMRERRGSTDVTHSLQPPLARNITLTRSVTNAFVPDRRESGTGFSSGKGSGENPSADEALMARAGRLREELYPEWFAKYRNGARLRLVSNTLEFNDAVSLVRTWDDERLEKLARIVLTTTDEFIAGTDRSFRIFALKASWADDRLRQVEKDRGLAV